jgi:predicted Ser/Thr protein kinase
MIDTTRPDGFLPEGSAALQQRIVQLRLAMQAGWQRGERRGVEHYLPQYADLAGNDEAVLDCIYGEYVLREELGETPDPEEFCRRFPRLAEPLRRLFTVDRALVAGKDASTDPHRGGVTLPLPHDHLPPAAAPAAPAQPSLPAAIGKYRVVGILGSGGQGIVYRAVHPTLGKDVVIKVARWSYGAAEERELLLHEGRLLAELDHPYLARVYDFDFHEGRPFLVMEFIRGQTLAQYAAQHRPSPRQVARLVALTAGAIATAHRRGIVHRDLKPDNILIDETDRPRVIDFGLAQWRDAWQHQVDPAGTIAGTLQYMAPEQAAGDTARIGPATDVYALGGVLFHLLTGKPLVEGKSLTEVLAKVKAGDVNVAALKQAAVPRRLAAVCRRALSRDPAQRPPTAAFAEDLETACRPRWTAGRLTLVAGSLLFVLAGFAAWWVTQHEIETPLPQPATASSLRVQVTPTVTSNTRLPAFVYDTKLPTLFVRIADDDDRENKAPGGDLFNKLPVLTGYEMQVEVSPPQGLHVTLFYLSSSGKLVEMVHMPRTTEAVKLYYPSKDATQFATLRGPSGTECWLVCGNRSGPVTVADLEKIWPKAGAWPQLPKDALYRLMRGQIVAEAGNRDIGEVKQRDNPEGEVVRFLEELESKLRPQVDYYEGLAFGLTKRGK